MARFERLDISLDEWGKILERFEDRIVFQTPAWLSFLAESQRGEVVIAALKDESRVLGYFSGLVVTKFGMRILGSPFRGWSTPYMGFNLEAATPRRVAISTLADFAFHQLRCLHFEVVDSFATAADVEGLHCSSGMNPSLEIDLTQSEDALFANMTKSCRWTVRKAEKNGVTIERAADEGFARDYAEQLKDVFAKQGLVPHFGEDRVRMLIGRLQPTGNLLLLRARDPQGRCLGTGIYPGLHEKAYYWGGASWREFQKLYPNELLHWHALRYWKSRGAKIYNLVGTMAFKQKFGGKPMAVPMISQSRHKFISFLRLKAPSLIKSLMGIAWRIRGRSRGPDTHEAEAPDSALEN